MESYENFPLDFILIIRISVLYVLLYAQIKGGFSLYLVGLMVSLKYMLSSPTHGKGGWMVPLHSLGAPKIILGGLGLYKPSAPGLVSDALIL